MHDQDCSLDTRMILVLKSPVLIVTGNSACFQSDEHAFWYAILWVIV